jgi:hypothetical protein
MRRAHRSSDEKEFRAYTGAAQLGIETLERARTICTVAPTRRMLATTRRRNR